MSNWLVWNITERRIELGRFPSREAAEAEVTRLLSEEQRDKADAFEVVEVPV